MKQKSQSKDLDQFYTNPEVAKELFETLDIKGYHLLEPSAGTGAFSDLFPETPEGNTKLDIDPKKDDIIKMDFFTFQPTVNNKIFTIGNPPFGKNSSLAVKFFNKAAEYSHRIAFIIPKTFRKESLQNKLNRRFHLITDKDIPKDSFIFNGEPYDVPCCFQVWERGEPRNLHIPKKESQHFKIVSIQEADFLIQRVGATAGKASKDFHKSPSSHYGIKGSENVYKIAKESYDDFQKVAGNCAGNPSLSKSELITIIDSKIKDKNDNLQSS